MIYWQLFISFLKIGAFSFGGGYAALPLIQNEVVTNHHWLSMKDFTDLITISQMTPGPIAINSATFVGIRVGGLLGAIMATLGSVLPSILIVTVIAYLYLKYRNLAILQSILQSLRPAVVAMIASAGVAIIFSALFKNQTVALEHFSYLALINFGICLFLLMKKKANPIYVMVLAGFLNVVATFILK